MERDTFDRIFREHGIRGLVPYRNELTKQLDMDPTNDLLRLELYNTITMCLGMKRMKIGNKVTA